MIPQSAPRRALLRNCARLAIHRTPFVLSGASATRVVSLIPLEAERYLYRESPTVCTPQITSRRNLEVEEVGELVLAADISLAESLAREAEVNA